MSNEIVKYENRLDDIPLRRFNTREMNLFLSIVSRVRDKGTDEIELSFDELKDLSNYKDHGERFVRDLDSTYAKLLSLNAYTDDGNTLTRFVAFNRYSIVRDEEIVKIAVNPDFKGLFNELGTWTRFSLEQFANLSSTYSKTMFRLLKRWRTQPDAYSNGHFWSTDEFRRLLDIPKSYQTTDIDKRILKPIKEELSPLFKGLRIVKERDKHARGRKIAGYRFFWKPEAKKADDFSKGEVVEQAKALENIQYNASLTSAEKASATARVNKAHSKSKQSHHKATHRIEEQPEWLKQQQEAPDSKIDSTPSTPVSEETKQTIADGLAKLKAMRRNDNGVQTTKPDAENVQSHPSTTSDSLSDEEIAMLQKELAEEQARRNQKFESRKHRLTEQGITEAYPFEHEDHREAEAAATGVSGHQPEPLDATSITAGDEVRLIRAGDLSDLRHNMIHFEISDTLQTIAVYTNGNTRLKAMTGKHAGKTVFANASLLTLQFTEK